MQGYIKDFRKELDSSIWMMPPLYHRVWQYLKYTVNHQDNKIPMKDGSFMTIKAGQHLTSLNTIAENVSWYERGILKKPNRKTISDVIMWLEKQDMIKINRGKGNREYTLITLINWDLYQVNDGVGNRQYTPNTQSMDINNNANNDLEIPTANNVPTTEESDGVLTTGPLDDSAESEEISQTSEQAVSVLLNRFVQLRAKGFDYSPKDYAAACEIIAAGVPLEQALLYLTERFETYIPKHSRDRINGLNYCVGYILDKYQESQETKTFEQRRALKDAKSKTSKSLQGYDFGTRFG